MMNRALFKNRSVALLAAVASFLTFPAHAQAHLVSTGFGPFYDGMDHLVLSPEYWIPVLALSLYAGLKGKQVGQTVLWLHPAAWIIGGFIGGFFPWSTSFPVNACLILTLGLFVAADLPMPGQPIALVAILLGLTLGWLHGAAMQVPGTKWQAFAGVGVPIFLLVAIVEGFVVTLHQAWQRIGVRILGSWIAATGILLLGWSIHQNTHKSLFTSNP